MEFIRNCKRNLNFHLQSEIPNDPQEKVLNEDRGFCRKLPDPLLVKGGIWARDWGHVRVTRTGMPIHHDRVVRTEISLVPRPSTPPAFDRFQYAKTEGEGLGNLLT